MRGRRRTAAQFCQHQCGLARQCLHQSISAIERFNNLTPDVFQQLPVSAHVCRSGSTTRTRLTHHSKYPQPIDITGVVWSEVLMIDKEALTPGCGTPWNRIRCPSQLASRTQMLPTLFIIILVAAARAWRFVDLASFVNAASAAFSSASLALSSSRASE